MDRHSLHTFNPVMWSTLFNLRNILKLYFYCFEFVGPGSGTKWGSRIVHIQGSHSVLEFKYVLEFKSVLECELSQMYWKM